MSFSITVFASSQPAPAPYQQLARDLGRAIAAAGHRLVFGGGNEGLMADVCRACIEAGGTAHGIILDRFLTDGQAYESLASSMDVHATMWERKRGLVEAGDGYVALPGGLGTLEELTEVLSLSQLGLIEGRVAVLSPDGFFDPLLAQLDRCTAEGLMHGEPRYAGVRSAAEAMSFIELGE